MNYNKIRATWWSGTCYHKEQLDLVIANTDVKNYAYILHDKDKQENSDELKKPHYHFLIQLQQKQRGSWFKQFASDDMGIVFAEPCFAPQCQRLQIVLYICLRLPRKRQIPYLQ